MLERKLNLRNMVKIGVTSLAVVLMFVSCEKDDAKQIIAFSFSVPPAVGVIDELAKSITVNVPEGTEVTALTPTIKVSEKATLNPSPWVVQNFTNPVKYTVTAENGSTAIYIVTLIVSNSNGNGNGNGDDVKDVLINGVRWATCNVDNPGSFTKNSEGTGMFYQWNSKIGWSVTDPIKSSNEGTTWTYEYHKDVKWEKANDPSPVGYRVPTIEEIDKLLDEKSVTREWVTQKGVQGMKFIDKATGKFIFLPAVGRRYYNGRLEYVGSGGCYWSSMQNYDVYGQCLEFVSNYAGKMGHEFGYGNSVRPVAE